MIDWSRSNVEASRGIIYYKVVSKQISTLKGFTIGVIIIIIIIIIIKIMIIIIITIIIIKVVLNCYSYCSVVEGFRFYTLGVWGLRCVRWTALWCPQPSAARPSWQEVAVPV